MTDAQTPGEPPPEATRPRCLAAIVTVLLLSFVTARSQGPLENPDLKRPEGDSIAPPVFAGLYLGFSSTFHSTSIPDEISCGTGAFTDGRASRLPFGLFFELPATFIRPDIRFLSRFSIGTHDVVISGSRFLYQFVRPGSDLPDTAELLTELHATLRTTTMSAGLAWEVAGTGLRIGLEPTVTAITRAVERRTERYLSPDDARYPETGSPVRDLSIGSPVEFDDLVYGADLSVGYRLRASRRISLFPQVLFGVSTSIARNVEWTVLAVTPSLGIGYDFSSDPPPVSLPPLPSDPPQPIDTTPVAALPVLAATVVAKGIDAEGREYDDPAIEIQEAPWTEVVPLLPALFFDSGSADIPGRYALLAGPAETASYSVDSLAGVTPVDIHWQILNIVGGRMRADREITVTISGTGSLDERSVESGLGIARAAAVARYLRNVWQIDSSRIRIASAARPSTPSNEERKEGREENRRVEFRFNRASAMQPVIVRRLSVVASPPAVKFDTDITADAPPADWSVTVVQGEKELLRFSGNSSAESLAQSKLWPLTDLRINKDMTPIRYHLTVTDAIGQVVRDSGTFRVVERVTRVGEDSLAGRIELYGYNLVGFDYGSAELLPRQLAELAEIARSASGQAQMTIIGYTDRVGSTELNRRLSLERARAVRDAIRNEQRRLSLPEAKEIGVQGLGERPGIYDNDIPEGRILSRMALVTISRLRSK